MPHRLGLSESILLFSEHRSFLDNSVSIGETIASLKKKSPEHRVIAEADSLDEALSFADGGADIVQVDKMQPEDLAALVEHIRREHPGVVISAAGGITVENAGLYAGTGIDIMVLSSVYFGKPSDIAVSLHPKAS